jgi:hypothetical protein
LNSRRNGIISIPDGRNFKKEKFGRLADKDWHDKRPKKKRDPRTHSNRSTFFTFLSFNLLLGVTTAVRCWHLAENRLAFVLFVVVRLPNCTGRRKRFFGGRRPLELPTALAGNCSHCY